MSKIWKVMRDTILVLLVIGVSFGGGYAFCKYYKTESVAIEDETTGIDLKLPGEVEKRIVTVEEVESKLVEMSNLSTYSSEYTVLKSADYTRYLLDDIPVPGTTNTITLECDGVVVVNYDVYEMVPTVDTKSQTIYISIPEPSSITNNIDWDGVRVVEKNNILNPIEFEQYHTLISEAKELGLSQAESGGLYEAAEQNVKIIIENYLSGFEYDIKFI